MLTCKQITQLVTDYLEGSLPFGQRMKFWMHMSMCGNCRRYLRQMKATIQLVGQGPVAPPPAEVRDALRQAFRNRKKPN